MKVSLFLVSILLLVSCSQETIPSKITVKASNVDFITIRNPIDDIVLWDHQTDTIYPNDKGEFLFSKEVEKPAFVTIKIGDTSLNAILLPGEQITINAKDSLYVFEGIHKAGMELLNDFERPFFSMNESNKYKKDSTSVQIEEKIQPLKAAELEQLQELIQNKKVEPTLAEILQKEIDYFYAQRIAEIVTVKQYEKVGINDNVLALFDKTIANYPLQTSYKSSNWNRYAEIVLQEKAQYDALKTSAITKDTLERYYLEDKLHLYYYHLIKTYKDATVAEKVAANYIINSTRQNKFEKSLIAVFDEFKADYPTSKYTKYLSNDIEKIKAYYVKISGEMPADVRFYENESIASLDELMKDLQGEKYYVDLWATWCGPCKREFKHNAPLNSLLKEKGYKKLYISLDKPNKRKKWKQDIKYFDLSGLHLMASQEFFADFEKKHSLHEGYVSIPQYLIIDANGTLITNNAPRPSDLEALRKLL